MAVKTLLSVLAGAAATLAQSDICSWPQARGGVVRDSLYMEGGMLSRGIWADGTWQNCQFKQTQQGSLYKLNFSKPFDTRTANFSSLFEQITETVDGSAPLYVDGAMFTNDYEWYTFGGLAVPKASAQSTALGFVRDGLYIPNAMATNAPLGPNPFYPVTANITKYVAYGAGASAPSEMLGFYFSGLKSPNGSRISLFSSAANGDTATTLVSTMMKVDTTHFNTASWTETTLPFIAPRAGSSMVWIPTSNQGALVVLGGVIQPADLSFALNSTQQALNTNSGTVFNTIVPVYDIANDQWFGQNTTGTPPPPFAQACTVVASAADGSSHQIYVYGGWDGNGASAQNTYDDVWILSVPAFVWIKANTGTSSHARYAHYCAKPYPNQMFSVGGVSAAASPLNTRAIVDVFDLNTLNWTGSYDPTKWSRYKIPSVVTAVIGGNENGSSTMFASSMTSNLRNLFSSKYSKNVTAWYPYTSQSITETPKSGGSSSAVKIAVPVVVVIVVLLTALIAWWFLCSPKARKRRSQKSSEETLQHPNNFVSRWVNGSAQYPPPPPKSVVSSDITEIGGTQSPRAEVPGFSYFSPRGQYAAAEADGLPVNGRGHAYSPTSRATSPGSHGSHPSAELEAGILPPMAMNFGDGGQRNTEVFRNHPYYPPSIGGLSVSSPALSSRYANARAPTESSLNGLTSFELPPNKSVENVDAIPTPLELEHSKFDETTTENSTEISGPSSSNADSNAIRTPELVPHQPRSFGQTQSRPEVGRSLPPSSLATAAANATNAHHRSTSSASSGMAITLSPSSPEMARALSPGEEQRRSDHIASLPDHVPRDVEAIAEQRQAEADAEDTTERSRPAKKSAYELNQKRMGDQH